MVADVFNNLSSVINQQFQTGSNKLSTLDIQKNGNTVPYGKLGDFANSFDQSAERSYTEEGMYRTDLFNPKVKLMEFWMQEPDVTILVKKRAFSSLAENYRTDLLNKDEQLFLRATKMLFQNKCNQIAAYERLTKIADIAQSAGGVDDYLFPALFASTDVLGEILDLGELKTSVDRIRTIVSLSKDQQYTTWLTNVQSALKTNVGQGTGVIEFTTAFSLNTTTSVNFGSGKFDISFIDPYNIMRVTHNDIEQAIADATNPTFSNSMFQFGVNSLDSMIQTDKQTLNALRARRGANPIIFMVNPDTFLGKRVRAIIDNSGIEIQFDGSITNVDVDPAYLAPGNNPTVRTTLDVISSNAEAIGTGADQSVFGVGSIAGDDGLSKAEEQIFDRIVSSLFNQLQLNQNASTITRAHNAETNGLRNKMRLHYGSKLMVQPMDVVHIFVNSKTKVDDKILGGLQDSLNAFNVLQTANKTLTNLQDSFNVDGDSVEKSIFVGKDFPTALWVLMRNQLVRDTSGTQIFCGLVDHSSYSYDSNGTFTVNVSGGDNSTYFGFGVVNIQPAQEVWNGSLYDPITPFDIKFDRATGFQKDTVPELLPENKQLFNSAFVKYKNGVYVGKKPSVNNFIQDTERVQNTSVRKVFYDPDGMVYKWKEGIGTLVMFGNNYQDAPSNVSVAPLTKDPFAGQDIMNVLSLLITGEPYNFATFYKAASQFDNFGRDPMTGADPSVSYFRNLQSDIKKRNLLYGNFVPFKSLSVDTDTFKTVLNNQIRASGFDSELNDLLQQQADLTDRMTKLGNLNNSQRVATDTQNIAKSLADINVKISAKQTQISNELNQINQPMSIIGNDISLDYNPSLPSIDKNDLSGAKEANSQLRRRIRFLTRRLSWKVRANEDVNLFIVDDTYDKDYDIQSFVKDPNSNLDLFRSDYVTVDEKIKHIKELIDLEVFADSQGHIQVRPPQYNKVPSSVFYRMLRLKNEFDIQLYPQFIEDLYVNQINSITDRISILEDEIRMYGVALAISTDAALASYLSASTGTVRGNTASLPFSFISDEGTGSVSQVVLQDLSTTADPVDAAQTFANGLESLKSVTTQATINNILSVSTRSALLNNLSKGLSGKGVSDIIASANTTTRQATINARLQAKTGQTFDLNQLFPNSAELLGRVRISDVDLLRILGEIADRISERQKLLKTATNAIKNAKEGLSLIQNKGQIGTKLLTPGLNGSSGIPEVLESIIEDESYDDYGPGSGKRFIIKDQYIKSMSIQESRPPFTAIEIQGRFGDNFNYNLPQDLNGFQNSGGNALTTAVAVDYDMWRMYGNSAPQSITAPYLTNPETQCAPFAVAMLNKARKQIQTGTINLMGNEYMQPGEVVYLETQDMLYYVESVNHRFAYGKEFSTSLNVGYGHMPGEYIPTYLDVVGKILYKNRDITNFVSVRGQSVNNEEHIGVITGSITGSLSASDSITSGTFATENASVLRNILDTAENVFSVTDTNYKPQLELRVYCASGTEFPEASTNATNIGFAIKDFLLGNNQMSVVANSREPSSLLRDHADQITVLPVDSIKTEEFRSPSSQAYMMARRAASVASGSTVDRDSGNTNGLVDYMLYQYVVDCWVYFDNGNNTNN
jgi:hypothetical protein